LVAFEVEDFELWW
jgi:hypothetical protein